MPTLTSIPLGEYLNTVYRPDLEYVDGELRERNMGKWEHSRVQALLTNWFVQHESEWRAQTATEWRTQVATTRVRIPDIVLVRQGAQPDVLTEAPLLVVEILSPDDTYSEMQERAQDYLQMGVTTIWILDPQTRTARLCTGRTWTETDRLEVLGTPIYVDVRPLFSQLDVR